MKSKKCWGILIFLYFKHVFDSTWEIGLIFRSFSISFNVKMSKGLDFAVILR